MNHVAQASGACCIAELLFCSPPAPSLVRGASRTCGIPVAVSGVSPGALIQWFMERSKPLKKFPAPAGRHLKRQMLDA
jgi:hypothetical protein